MEGLRSINRQRLRPVGEVLAYLPVEVGEELPALQPDHLLWRAPALLPTVRGARA
jgi:hypothetical protein